MDYFTLVDLSLPFFTSTGCQEHCSLSKVHGTGQSGSPAVAVFLSALQYLKGIGKLQENSGVNHDYLEGSDNYIITLPSPSFL